MKTYNHWDDEMFEMKAKLDSILNDNWIYLDNKTLDYVLQPKSLGKPEGYEKWLKSNYVSDRTNATFRRIQKNKENLLRKRPRGDAPTYVCEHCGYTSQTWYPAAFNRFHNENCKENKTNKEIK